MGTKYSSNSIAGYNATPPPDDGATTESNKLKWSTIKNKLNDPIKTLVETINSEVNTALDYGPISLVSAALTLGASHNNQYIDMSGAATPTLATAAGLGAGWFVDVKNNGSNTITVARANTADTINTVSADVTMNTLDYIRFIVNAAADGFIVTSRNLQFASQAQVDAGTRSDLLVAPSTLRAASRRGALVYFNAATGGANIPWNSEAYDTDSIHDATTNEERLTVPPGVISVRLQVGMDLDTAGANQLFLLKNGVAFIGRPIITIPAAEQVNMASPVVSVNGGDYFTVNMSSGTAPINTDGSSNWFAMEILP